MFSEETLDPLNGRLQINLRKFLASYILSKSSVRTSDIFSFSENPNWLLFTRLNLFIKHIILLCVNF